MSTKELTAEAPFRDERSPLRAVGNELTVQHVRRLRGDGVGFEALELGIEKAGSNAPGVFATLDVYEAGELARLVCDFVEKVTGHRP